MADTLQVDLVSPERKLASLSASAVTIPGIGGDFTAMPNHAPFLTTLRPGVVRVVAGSETREYVVTSGAAIAPLGNTKAARREHGDRARMYRAGEVVHLTAAEARHYIGLKRLDPYVPADED